MKPAPALPHDKTSLKRKGLPQLLAPIYIFYLSFLLFQIPTNTLLYLFYTSLYLYTCRIFFTCRSKAKLCFKFQYLTCPTIQTYSDHARWQKYLFPLLTMGFSQHWYVFLSCLFILQNVIQCTAHNWRSINVCWLNIDFYLCGLCIDGLFGNQT